jgi:hypothetical protein
MDGGTTAGTTAIVDGTGIVTNHAGTMGQTTAVTLAAYLDDEITAMPNLVVDSANYTNGSVDYAHIQDVAANSILGRNANSSGVLSEVALATTQILIGDGTGFTAAALSGAVTMANTGAVTIANDAIDSQHYADGSIDTAHIADNNVTAAKIFDLARGSILVGNASAATAELTIGSDNYILTSDGTDIAWEAAAAGGISAGKAIALSMIFNN